MQKTFEVSRNKNATARQVLVTLPDSMKDLPEGVQAQLYVDAIANATIKVQSGLRRWLESNKTASPEALNAEAQERFDAILKGQRRQARTVVVEVVKTTEIDATATKLSKEQVAFFSAQEGVKLVNVPENLKQYVVTA